jgi:hypothetical protein
LARCIRCGGCRLCLQLMVSLHWQSHELHPECPSTRDMLVFLSRTVFSALSGMRLLACLIVAPQQGYDEPGILSYAITPFCPTSADGLHLAVQLGRRVAAPHRPSKTPTAGVRDGIGTTHHEAGTLWIDTNPQDSVTDVWGRFHHIENAYVAGPALFPTIGSANPMLTGTALARRAADKIARGTLLTVKDGPVQALDRAERRHWRMSGNGTLVDDGSGGIRAGLKSLAVGNGLGLEFFTDAKAEQVCLDLENYRWHPFDRSDCRTERDRR